MPPSTATTDRACWTAIEEEALLESMKESINKGLRSESGFKSEVWKSAISTIQALTNQTYTTKQVKAKAGEFKRRHRVWQHLIGHTGFGIDPGTGAAEADDAVWASYLQQHPEAKTFRRKPLAHQQLLDIIFGGTHATGRHALAPPSQLTQQDTQEDDEDDQIPPDSQPPVDDDSISSTDTIDEQDIDALLATRPLQPPPSSQSQQPQTSRKRTAAVTSTIEKRRKKVKPTGPSQISDAINNCATAVLAVNQSKTEEIPETKQAYQLFYKDHSQAPLDVQLTAMELLRHIETARWFLIMPLESRRAWVERGMRRQTVDSDS